jgi:hypothetical protein
LRAWRWRRCPERRAFRERGRDAKQLKQFHDWTAGTSEVVLFSQSVSCRFHQMALLPTSNHRWPSGFEKQEFESKVEDP